MPNHKPIKLSPEMIEIIDILRKTGQDIFESMFVRGNIRFPEGTIDEDILQSMVEKGLIEFKDEFYLFWRYELTELGKTIQL